MPRIIEFEGRRIEVPDNADDAFISEVLSQPAAAPASPAAPADEQPWYAQAGQAADDIARIVANGLTFGYADKLAGAASGNGTEAERALTEQARDRAGSAGTVAEIGSAVAVPMAAGKSGLTLAGRFGTDAATGLRGLAGRAGLMAAEGAGYGALTAAGNDQDVANGAAIGGVAGGLGNVAGEALAAGLGKVAGAFSKKPAIPTTEDVNQAVASAYKAADDAGVIFAPQAVSRLKEDVTQELASFGYLPKLQPKVEAILDEMNRLEGQNVTLKGMDGLRKMVSAAYDPANPSSNKILSDITRRLDDVLMNPAPGDVLAGDAAGGSAALKEARSMWSRLKKQETIETALGRGEANAAASGSGANTDNAIRQQLKPLLDNPKKTRGFTPDEDEALRTAVFGRPLQNSLRLVGKMAPTGVVSGGIGAGIGSSLGGFVGGPQGAQVGFFAGPAVGYLAKKSADAMSHDNAQRLIDIIMAGGTRAAAVPAPNAVQRFAEDATDPLIRSIMGAGAFAAGK